MRRALIVALGVITASCATTTMTSPTDTVDTDALLRNFSSSLVPGGSASRSFETTAAGNITVVLTSTTPAGVPVGLGVGISRANGSCALSTAIETAAGATSQIVIAADRGGYCAKVYDLGTLEAPLPFTISISHP